jgi:mRNA interferase MazF
VFKDALRVAKISLHLMSKEQKGRLIMIPSIKRGDIFYADLSPVVGSEQGGLRPVLIIQNDVGNRYSPTVIAAAITSRMDKTKLPTHIDIHADRVGLSKDSVILLEQIRTLDKRRLKEKMGHLDGTVMTRVNNAIAVSFGLGNVPDGYESAAVASVDGPRAEGIRDAGLLG